MKKYWYSEGYVYFEDESICKMYGTQEQQEQEGKLIAKLLNEQYTSKVLYFAFGLLIAFFIIFLVNIFIN